MRGFKEKGLRHIVNQPHSAAIGHAQCTVCTPPRAAVFHVSILRNIDRFTQTSLRALSLLTVVQNFVRDCSRVTNIQLFKIRCSQIKISTCTRTVAILRPVPAGCLVVSQVCPRIQTHPVKANELGGGDSVVQRSSEKYHQNEPTLPRV